MVTALHNMSNNMNHYYQQLVQYDMHDGGWEENGAAIRLLDMMIRGLGERTLKNMFR